MEMYQNSTPGHPSEHPAYSRHTLESLQEPAYQNLNESMGFGKCSQNSNASTISGDPKHRSAREPTEIVLAFEFRYYFRKK